jgi:hypothetical protein
MWLTPLVRGLSSVQIYVGDVENFLRDRRSIRFCLAAR